MERLGRFVPGIVAWLLMLALAGSAAAAGTHVVRPGERLQAVARQHAVPVERLREANGLTSDRILMGQRLLIPGPQDLVHRVQPGETLWLLGRRYGTHFGDLWEANHLSRLRLFAGESLLVPGVRPAPTEAAAGENGSPPDYGALQEQLAEILAAHPDVTFGIHLTDLASGETLAIGSDIPIRAASTIKLPIALHAYRQVAGGVVRLDMRVAYDRDRHFRAGAGALRHIATQGQTFSFGHLLKLMISLSDNVAWQMVRGALGDAAISGFMRGAGAQTVYPGGENVTSAADLSLYLELLLELERDHPQLAAMLIRDMRYGMWYVGIRAAVPREVPVAHKYGSLPPGMAGDTAVVGGARPYLLTILSDGWEEFADGFAALEEAAVIIHAFQTALPAREEALPPTFFH